MISSSEELLSALELVRCGRLDEAWQSAEVLLLGLGPSDPEYFATTFILTEVLRHRGEYEKALSKLASLSEPRPEDFDSQIGLLMHSGYNSALLGRYKPAHELLGKAERLSLSSGRLECHGEVLLRLGMLAYLEYRFDDAGRFYKSVLDTYGNRFGWYMHSMAVSGVGKALMARREYREALPWLEKVDQVFRSEGADFQLALNDSEIAVCLTGLGEYDKALELLHSAVSVVVRINAVHSYQVNLADIGNVYFAKRDYMMAISYYQAALTIAHDIKAAASIEKWTSNIRLAYSRMRQAESKTSTAS